MLSVPTGLTFQPCHSHLAQHTILHRTITSKPNVTADWVNHQTLTLRVSTSTNPTSGRNYPHHLPTDGTSIPNQLDSHHQSVMIPPRTALVQVRLLHPAYRQAPALQQDITSRPKQTHTQRQCNHPTTAPPDRGMA